MCATKAIRSLLRHGDLERLPAEERKSLTSFNFGNSGWILPPQMANNVLSCLVDQTNVASLMGQATISAGSIVFPVDNVNFEDSVGWACETECAVNQPSPDLSGLGQLEIKAETLRARVCAGSDMLADSSLNVEAWAMAKAARAFTHKISSAIIAGTGVGQPIGILNPQSHIPVCDTASTTPADQFTWSDLIQLAFQVPAQWRAGGSFLMNSRTLALTLTMSDAMGRPLLLPVPITEGARGGGFTFAGWPIIVVDQFPDIAPGSTPVAFGNWRETYLVVTRKATAVQMDPYSFGWCVGMKFEARVGGGVLCPNAARLLRIQ